MPICSNEQDNDVIEDENGIIRKRTTPPIKCPQRPVQIYFSEEEARARRRVWLGERKMLSSEIGSPE